MEQGLVQQSEKDLSLNPNGNGVLKPVISPNLPSVKIASGFKTSNNKSVQMKSKLERDPSGGRKSVKSSNS